MTRRLLLLGALALATGLALWLRFGPDRPPAPVRPAASTRAAALRTPDASPPDAAAALPIPPRLQLGWDPKSGRGDVVQTLAGGDRLRVAFQLDYPGYTGGLVIGGYNGSGYGYYPRQPVRGYRRINVFCAQDESIWDRAGRAEYSFGWSENYGRGDDGQRLAYQGGAVLENTPERLVLRGDNAGGCYHLRKIAYTRLGAPFWIIATRVTNRCKHPVTFDFFSGDDPWIGRYRSSDGDVGWVAGGGLVRRETALGPGRFEAGGFYDLGNQALGQKEGARFSNQANVIALDPALPLPDLALFANRFAHRRAEVDPTRPLDNRSLSALNLGWRGVTLAPGRGLVVAMALGLARTGQPGSEPRVPEISDADWSVWRRHLPEDGRQSGVAFAAERVELSLDPDALTVTGRYTLQNHDPAAVSLEIAYPILSGPDRPAPKQVTVGGRPYPVTPSAKGPPAAHFSVSVPPRGIARFTVRYRQLHRGRRAGYMVTSARTWGRPLRRAVFVVRHKKGAFGPLRLSFRPDDRYQQNGQQHYLVVRQPFLPKEELWIRW